MIKNLLMEFWRSDLVRDAMHDNALLERKVLQQREALRNLQNAHKRTLNKLASFRKSGVEKVTPKLCVRCNSMPRVLVDKGIAGERYFTVTCKCGSNYSAGATSVKSALKNWNSSDNVERPRESHA
jgi:hypothetical protein